MNQTNLKKINMDFNEERTKILDELDDLCKKECVNSIGKPMFKVGALVSMLAKERLKNNELIQDLEFFKTERNI